MVKFSVSANVQLAPAFDPWHVTPDHSIKRWSLPALTVSVICVSLLRLRDDEAQLLPHESPASDVIDPAVVDKSLASFPTKSVLASVITRARNVAFTVLDALKVTVHDPVPEQPESAVSSLFVQPTNSSASPALAERVT